MKGIAFTQHLQNRGKQSCEIIIAALLGRILSYGIRHFQDGRIVPSLCIDNSHIICILHAEINVLEDFGSFTSGAKGINGNGHTYGDRDEDCYHCDCNHC